jgi:hypothetical protein
MPVYDVDRNYQNFAQDGGAGVAGVFEDEGRT